MSSKAMPDRFVADNGRVFERRMFVDSFIDPDMTWEETDEAFCARIKAALRESKELENK